VRYPRWQQLRPRHEGAASFGRGDPDEPAQARREGAGHEHEDRQDPGRGHHDTDLYDLKIRDDGSRTALIDTTFSHLFWVPSVTGHGGSWVEAGALPYGTRLRAPSGSDTAVVTSGWVPPPVLGLDVGPHNGLTKPCLRPIRELPHLSLPPNRRIRCPRPGRGRHAHGGRRFQARWHAEIDTYEPEAAAAAPERGAGDKVTVGPRSGGALRATAS